MTEQDPAAILRGIVQQAYTAGWNAAQAERQRTEPLRQELHRLLLTAARHDAYADGVQATADAITAANAAPIEVER